jgi:type III restriction enzyme
MKFKFNKNLDYQLDAIRAIVDIFDTGKNVFGTETIVDKNKNALFENIKVVKNVLETSDARIIQNVHAIQKENKLESSEVSEREVGPIGTFPIGTLPIGAGYTEKKLKEGMDFSVEMETGTGKTYVYLRTIFELNKKYGLKKFIILVPSVAIREGVLKTLQQTKEHFKELYNIGYDYFAYDSRRLSKVKSFAQNLDLQIMIMTIQSFNKDTNIMHQTPDRFNGEKPIDLVAMTNPIVIMDEPQNMESEFSKSAIKDLHPLFKLRYSATHKDKKNLMYVLSPSDAYRQGLVKKIEVYGVEESDPGAFIFKVKEIRTQRGKSPVALAGIEIKNADGEYIVKDMLLKMGDNLERKTANSKYSGLYINEITAQYNHVELSNSKYYKLEEILSENKEAIFRTQIRETIKAHMNRQKELDSEIKVLSLFFIDRVDNYVNNGLISKIFEEEFGKLKENYEQFRAMDTTRVHNGYFANTRSKSGIIYKDTRGDSQIDKEVYDLIMKDKEKLLSFSEPTSFIFSHSALKEGWDNPNVFQICTLNETRSSMRKRQEIGRGMRLCVDKNGDRIYSPRVNVLTVVANESYKDFVGSLQGEYDEAGYREIPETSNARERVNVRLKKGISLENEYFKELWQKISQKTKFSIKLNSEKLIENIVAEMSGRDIDSLVVRVEKVLVDMEDGGKLKTVYLPGSIGEKISSNVRIGNVLERIANETNITKKTAFEILDRIDNLELIFENPEEFIRTLVLIVESEKEKLLINEGLKYYPVNDAWQVELVFDDLETYVSKCIETEKSAYDQVVYDSEGEREFAQNLDLRSDVKLFVKLPPKFIVDTPLGTYNPDWAIVIDDGSDTKLYLVRETKFGTDFDNLRLHEKQKILCGEKHFETIGVDFKVAHSKELRDLITK